MMDHEDTRRSGRVTEDSGGKTRFGIAQKFHPHLAPEFFTMDRDQALAFARTFYQANYWEDMQLRDLVDQLVADKLLDMGVNMGVTEAAHLAQRAASGLLLGSASAPKDDGKWGPKTIAALNGCAPANLIETLCNLSKIFYYEAAEKKPAEKKYLPNWLKRSECRPDKLCDEHVLAAAAAGGAQ